MLIVLVQMNTNCYFQSDPCKAEDFSENKAKEKFFSTLLWKEPQIYLRAEFGLVLLK